MGPEFLMEGNSSTDKEGNKGPARPFRGRGSWRMTPMEIKEAIEDTHRILDQQALSVGAARRFERKHGVEQKPKLDGLDRLGRLGDDLDKAIRVGEGELGAGQESTGFRPPVSPLPKSPEPSKT